MTLEQWAGVQFLVFSWFDSSAADTAVAWIRSIKKGLIALGSFWERIWRAQELVVQLLYGMAKYGVKREGGGRLNGGSRHPPELQKEVNIQFEN